MKPWEKDWSKSSSAKPWEKDWKNQSEPGALKQLGESFIDALPAAGAVAGGVIGAGAGLGIGSVPAAVGGSALGAMGGESLKRTIKAYLGQDQGGVSDIVKSQVIAGLEGATAEAGGQVVGKVLSSIPSVIQKTSEKISNFSKAAESKPVANLDEIEAAAKRLGIKPIDAMKTSNKFYQDLESGLSQSGTFPAMKTRKAYDDFFEAMESSGQKIAEQSTGRKSFPIGKDIFGEVEKTVEAGKKPVSEMYESLTAELQLIPIDKAEVNKQIGFLKRNPIFKTQEGSKTLERLGADLLDSSKTLADLKEFRTNLQKSLPKTASDLEKSRIDEFYNAVTKIRNGSINASTQTNEFIAKGGKKVQAQAASILDDIALADAAHSSNMKEINSLKELVGSKKEFSSQNQFLEALDALPEEELTKRAINSSLGTKQFLKEKFPPIFEKVKEAEINELVKGSTNTSGFNDTTFLKKFDGLNKELQEMLFDADSIQYFKDIKTIKNAIPERLGPSGTPKGMMTMSMFNPKQNLEDFLISRVLKSNNSGAIKGTAEAVSSVGSAVKQGIDTAKAPATRQAIRWTIPSEQPLPPITEVAKQKEKQQEPQSKWIDNGIKRINKVSPIFADLDKIKNDKQIQALLLKASGATDEQVKKIAEQLQNTEAFKKAPKGGPKTSNKYPMVLKQNGFKVTIKNDQDYYEAKSEGWA